MMEEFDLGKTIHVHFRLQEWLLKDIADFMAASEINNQTQGLHDYVSFLKNRIEQQKKEISDLKRDQRSYVQDKTPSAILSAMPSATASAGQPAQAPVIPEAPPALTIHCPHYAKQVKTSAAGEGLKSADISEHACQKIQEVRPDLCKAAQCSRFKLAPAAVQVPLETEDTRPKGLV